MRVYQDLDILGSVSALQRFVESLPETGGWTRNRALEAEVRAVSFGQMYCFSCTNAPARLAADLWLASRREAGLYVANILAHARPSLTYDEYNAILMSFYEAVALPASVEAGVTTRLGNPAPRIEDFLSGPTADRLRAFSGVANRSILHPRDRHRWNEFLSAAYRERARLSTDLLQRWLIEDERWPEDMAIELAAEYEHARELLEVHESQNA